jgi:hypothetical protein
MKLQEYDDALARVQGELKQMEDTSPAEMSHFEQIKRSELIRLLESLAQAIRDERRQMEIFLRPR